MINGHSVVFLFIHGNNITLPTERYVTGGNVYTEFTSRNGSNGTISQNGYNL